MRAHSAYRSALRLRRFISRVRASVLWLLTAVVDAGPGQLRFGVGRTLRNRVLSIPLATMPDVTTLTHHAAQSASGVLTGDPLVVLVTRTLGTGGVEAVVATLARQLPAHSLRTVVLCEDGGATADALRKHGVEVVDARHPKTAASFLANLPTDAVAQLHNAPDHLIEAFVGRGIPIVPVIHTTDINLAPDQWEHQARITELALMTIVVSERVRIFYARNLPRPAGSPIVVVPNGVDLAAIPSEEVNLARAKLASVLKVDLTHAIVLICLARYDMQKNIPGLVTSFLGAAEVRDDLHLIVAGPVEDWLEHALADAIRRSHPAASRVHLMGSGLVSCPSGRI